MQETQFIWHKGKLMPWAEATVHVMTHTLHYGGGSFEGIRFYETEKGVAIFKLQAHIDRLFYSAAALKMVSPYTKEQVADIVIQVVRANQIKAGYIRPLLFYGYGKMGVNPVGSPVELMVACWPWGAYLPHELADVKISHYMRIHPRTTVVDAKLCGHYVNSILASLELAGTHYHEALLLDTNGYVAEGVGENFFLVKNNVIYTPKLGTIIAGITRDTVFELAKQLAVKIVEVDIMPAEIYDADEAFFTGTAAEITPIRSVDDKVLNQGNLGPITSIIKSAYYDLVRGKNPAFMDCLTMI